MLRRRSTLRPSKGTQIPPDIRRAVEQRDRSCVGAIVGMPKPCAGGLELDHVRSSGALGRKSPSTLDNLVRLCAWHHHFKTLNGREWRPVLIEYIEKRAGQCTHVDPVFGCEGGCNRADPLQLQATAR